MHRAMNGSIPTARMSSFLCNLGTLGDSDRYSGREEVEPRWYDQSTRALEDGLAESRYHRDLNRAKVTGMVSSMRAVIEMSDRVYEKFRLSARQQTFVANVFCDTSLFVFAKPPTWLWRCMIQILGQ